MSGTIFGKGKFAQELREAGLKRWGFYRLLWDLMCLTRRVPTEECLKIVRGLLGVLALIYNRKDPENPGKLAWITPEEAVLLWRFRETPSGITMDEILDLHQFLGDFDGDMKDLLE